MRKVPVLVSTAFAAVFAGGIAMAATAPYSPSSVSNDRPGIERPRPTTTTVPLSGGQGAGPAGSTEAEVTPTAPGVTAPVEPVGPAPTEPPAKQEPPVKPVEPKKGPDSTKKPDTTHPPKVPASYPPQGDEAAECRKAIAKGTAVFKDNPAAAERCRTILCKLGELPERTCKAGQPKPTTTPPAPKPTTKPPTTTPPTYPPTTTVK